MINKYVIPDIYMNRRDLKENSIINILILLVVKMPKKTEKKKQDKIIEDRTFGLKNKNKSKAVQK